ncbi:MAG TPA: hypothetical protein VLJ38_15005 [Polyangiaceae bacterium]|nr:hypothetical protein [Polyangiaceae bacterium]
MRSAFARLLMVLAALMLLPGSAWGGILYRCQMSGRVQASCCCDAGKKSAAPESVPGVRASDCCERLIPGDRSKATTPQAASDSVQPAALAAVLSVPLAFGPNRRTPDFAVRQSRAPPGPRRLLFSVHCAYLC